MLMSPMRANLPAAVLALMFLAGGIFALVWFSRLIVNAGDTAGWPSVEGHLLKSRVNAHWSSTTIGRVGTRSEKTSYGLDVEYEYRVRGILYRGQRFSFEPRNSDREHWEKKAGMYRAGERVNVYYDPRNPADSVLETGAHGTNYIFIVLGLILTGSGAYLTARAVRFRFFVV